MTASATGPLARSEDLLAEQVGDEMIVFDTGSGKAHCLAPLAACVFVRCDGRTSVAELAEIASSQLGEPVPAERIENVLADLQSTSLLAESEPWLVTRRHLMRKGALVGAAVAATPFVTTVVPQAMAASCIASVCSNNGDCSGFTCGTGNCRCKCDAGGTGNCGANGGHCGCV